MINLDNFIHRHSRKNDPVTSVDALREAVDKLERDNLCAAIKMTPQREFTSTDAPVELDNLEASAWAYGANCAYRQGQIDALREAAKKLDRFRTWSTDDCVAFLNNIAKEIAEKI